LQKAFFKDNVFAGITSLFGSALCLLRPPRSDSATPLSDLPSVFKNELLGEAKIFTPPRLPVSINRKQARLIREYERDESEGGEGKQDEKIFHDTLLFFGLKRKNLRPLSQRYCRRQ
jgi:hypothetical protein